MDEETQLSEQQDINFSAWELVELIVPNLPEGKPQKLVDAIKTASEIINKSRLVVWKDGSYRYFENGITWEYENDPDWLATIELKTMYPQRLSNTP